MEKKKRDIHQEKAKDYTAYDQMSQFSSLHF